MNNGFERLVLSGPAGKRYNFPEMKIPNMRCSMANARVHGLPGALEDAADAVQAPVRKRLKGSLQCAISASPGKMAAGRCSPRSASAS